MPMSMPELERALRTLRLSGMIATLDARALQVANREMDFLEAVSWLVQDELDRRRSRLLERRYALSGLPERKDLTSFDWSYNPRLPRRAILELATLKFLDAHENLLAIGPPGTGKSHVAKALATAAVGRGFRVLYREVHRLIEDLTEARELGTLRPLRAQIAGADLLVIDDLFLRKLPSQAGDELADVLMARYEKASTILTSNRPLDDWPRLLGDVVVVAPLLDRLMHHGHLLKFEGKRWRLKEAAARAAQHQAASSLSPVPPPTGWGTLTRPRVEEFEVAAGAGAAPGRPGLGSRNQLLGSQLLNGGVSQSTSRAVQPLSAKTACAS